MTDVFIDVGESVLVNVMNSLEPDGSLIVDASFHPSGLLVSGLDNLSWDQYEQSPRSLLITKLQDSVDNVEPQLDFSLNPASTVTNYQSPFPSLIFREIVVVEPPEPEPVYDPDALLYFTRVEGPDGDNQPLEPEVKTAIDNFIAGCKTDGIWDAIKASCILAGARTLQGALQPLVGTAPSNINFVSNDYNRKTGLLGNGVDKYLNANISSSSLQRNNVSVLVRLESAPSIRGHLISASNPPFQGFELGVVENATNSFIRANNSGNSGALLNAAPGTYGLSRSISSSYSQIRAGVISTVSLTSNTLIDRGFFLFGNGAQFAEYCNARLSFYSIGENLNLALLDARLTTLMSALNTAIPELITSGLVLNLDAANTASYPGSGTTWTDLSGNGNNGTLVNGVGYSPSGGGTLVFDGVNDYGSVNHTTALNPGTGDFTFGGFFKVNSDVPSDFFPTFLNKSALDWQNGYFIRPVWPYNGTFTVGISQGGNTGVDRTSITSTLTAPLGTWVNIVGVWTASTRTLLLYFNGIQNGSSTITGTITINPTANLELARYNRITRSRYDYLSGNIAQIGIYNRALTPEEINQNYLALESRFL